MHIGRVEERPVAHSDHVAVELVEADGGDDPISAGPFRRLASSGAPPIESAVSSWRFLPSRPPGPFPSRLPTPTSCSSFPVFNPDPVGSLSRDGDLVLHFVAFAIAGGTAGFFVTHAPGILMCPEQFQVYVLGWPFVLLQSSRGGTRSARKVRVEPVLVRMIHSG